MVSITSEEWAQAKSNEMSATMQVSFPTIFFERGQDVFSSVMAELPVRFPKLKLNTIGRGLHSTLLYLDHLTLSEMRELVQLLTETDRATLERYGLLGDVRVFDPNNVEFVVLGTKSKFLALKPHAEFVEWQIRFYKFIEDRAPQFLARHLSHGNLGQKAVSRDAVHISLVQWGEQYGVDLSKTEIENIKNEMSRIFKRAAKAYSQSHKLAATTSFNIATSPLEIVTAPVSIHTPPLAVVALRLEGEGGLRASEVGRVYVEEAESGFKKIVEFRTSEFMAGKEAPYEVKLESGESWIDSSRKFEAVELADFKGALSPNVRQAYTIAETTLSPTKYPAVVPTTDPGRIGKFYVASHTHPKLAPEKAFEVLEKARKLDVRSTNRVSVGLAVYASSVREEIKTPGDFDLLINSLVTVPDSVDAIEKAEKFAADAFTHDVLEQLIAAARQKRIAFTELRMGSEVTMNMPVQDVVVGLEENPYLSEQHLLEGKYTDRTGKTWTLAELVGLGDFIKGKVDLFHPGYRDDLSLQFLVGFKWRGAVYFLQRNGIKGVPALLRTAVYDGAESYAIAASLSRPQAYYQIQKGSILSRAIRDMMKTGFAYTAAQRERAPVLAEPLWNSKFIKRFYNFLILLNRSGMGLDEIFFKETRALLQRDGQWLEGYSLGTLVDSIVKAINHPELKVVNALKRDLNDLSEFNERKQVFRVDQWRERRIEIAQLLIEIEAIFKTGLIEPTPEFQRAFRGFKSAFYKAERMATPEDAIDYFRSNRMYSMLHNFEMQLTALEGQIITRAVGDTLSPMDKRFIRTMGAYSPTIYYRYLKYRSQDADAKMSWNVRLMGIEPTADNMAAMDALADGMFSLTREQFAERQKGLHSSHCEGLLLGGDVQ